MKIIIVVILTLYYTSCSGQNNEKFKGTKGAIPVDTLSILLLQNNRNDYDSYEVLHLFNLDDSGYGIDSTERIELTKDKRIIATIFLPNSENVNNFSVTGIVETGRGFKVVVNWGGGNYFYGREFYFTLKYHQFYFDSLKMSSFTLETERETKTTKKINPPIPIDKFEIANYLVNE